MKKAVVAEEKSGCTAGYRNCANVSNEKSYFKTYAESYLTAPTFALNYEIDMTEAIALRKKILDTILESTGKKNNNNRYYFVCSNQDLLKHKFVNSSLSERTEHKLFCIIM